MSMKIKYIALCLLLVLVGCQRDEEMEITQLTISNERIEPSCSSVTISCDITSNVTIKEAKVYVSESTDVSAAKTQVLSKKNGNTYSAEIDGLADGATYYVRYQISNRWVLLMAEEISEFQTIPATKPTVTTTQPKEITHNSAIMGGKIVDNGGLTVTNCGVVYSKSSNPTIENSTKVESNITKEAYTCTLTNLDFATTYYARAYAINEKGIAYGEEISLTTLSTSATMGDISAIEIGGTTATIQAELLTDGGASIEKLGICYNMSGEPTINDSIVLSSENKIGIFQCAIDHLSGATTYYVRAFATNVNGTVYSDQISIRTETTTATVVTSQATNVSYTSAIVGGNVTEDGGAEVTERGVVYSTNQSPTTEDSKVASGSGLGEFTCNLTDLQDGTTYYARAYAINKKGISYGEEVSFTTKTKTIATIATTPATNVSYTSATVGGNVTDDGGAEVIECGLVYATTQNPTTADTKVTKGSELGEFTCSLTGLQDGTTYYARAYAINAKGTAYGDEVRFTTKTKTIATVATTPATNVSYTSAKVGGNVTEDGGAEVIERGIVYSTNQNPTVADSKVTNGSGLGEFTCNLINLQDATTYYARSYATNERGTAYGNEVSFTTKGKTTPTVTTNTPSEITYTQAMIQGSVSDDGGVTVTEKGICYSTSPNPTIDNNKRTNGSGTGTITCVFSALQDGTMYYARAYAINALGVGYGNEVSFTTMAYEVPQITIANPTKYSVSTAIIDCEVTFGGGLEVTERGVCYSITSNPTYSNDKVQNGSGLGAYSCELSNLSENTTYYVRAYAKNTEGIGYSREVSFTTRTRTYMDGYEYVDLGLSVKWASYNIGATKPEEYGDYFAWGETTTKSTYNWSTYKWRNGSDNSLTKYNTKSSYGTVDNKTKLDAIDDAAVVNWGGSWRMPTHAEMTELRDNCTWTWTSQNGVNGCKVTSKRNGNSIFFPAAGYRDDSSLYNAGSYGYYWSSSLHTLYTDYPDNAHVLHFRSDDVDWVGRNRGFGFSVRPVCQ